MKVIGNGFTTQLPGGWEDRSMITLVGPTSPTGFAVNAVVMRERAGPRASVEDYALRQRQAMEAEVAGLEVLDERPARINGAPAYQRLQRFSAQGHNVQQVQSFILFEGVIFIITCTASIEDFNNHLHAFRSLVDCFQCFNPENVPL